MNRLIIILFFLVLIISCRENIIKPDEFVGNVNEPVQSNLLNSYIFVINAQDLSTNVAAFPTYTSTLARVSITLVDYKSGYAKVILKDFNQVERFQYFINEDVDVYTEIIDGFRPSKIEIKMQQLSGKLKVQLSRAF